MKKGKPDSSGARAPSKRTNSDSHPAAGMDLRARGEDPAARAVRLEKKLEDIDPLAQLGFEASALVHDLSNILGGMMGYIQLAQMTGDEEDWQKCIRVVGDGLQREKELVAAFKANVSGKRTLVVCNVRDEIRKALEFLGPELAREGIAWSLSGDGLHLMTEPKALRKAILMSAVATAASLPPGARVEVELRRGEGELILNVKGAHATGKDPPGAPNHRDEPGVRISDNDLQYLKSILFETGGRLDDTASAARPSGFRFVLPIL